MPLLFIVLRSLVSICYVSSVLPLPGILLPFFSYGGTASFFLLIEIGLVLSVNKYSVKKRLDDLKRERLE